MIWKVEYGAALHFSGLSASLQGRLNLELADSVAGGILDCPTCTLKIFSDDVVAPNQAMATVVNAVPGPVAGAGIPGAIAAGMFLVGLARRRKQHQLAV